MISESLPQMKLHMNRKFCYQAFFLFYILMVNSTDYGFLYIKDQQKGQSLSFLNMISEIPINMSQALIYTIFLGLVISMGKIFYLRKQSYEIEIFCVILFPLQFYLCLNKILNIFYHKNSNIFKDLQFLKQIKGLAFIFIIVFHTLTFLMKTLKTNFRYANSRMQGFNPVNYRKLLFSLTKILLISILPIFFSFQYVLIILAAQTLLSSYLYINNINYEHPKVEILSVFGQIQGWMQLIKLFLATQTSFNFQVFNFVIFVLISTFYIKPQKISKLVLEKYQKVFQIEITPVYARVENEASDFFNRTKQQHAIIKFSLMIFYYLEDDSSNLSWPPNLICQIVKQLENNTKNNLKAESIQIQISKQNYQNLIIKSNKNSSVKSKIQKHEYQNLFWNYVNNQPFFKTQDNFKYFYIYNMVLGGTRNKYRVLSIFHKIKERKNIFEKLQIELAYNYIIQFICKSSQEMHQVQNFLIGNDPNLHSAQFQQILKQETQISQILKNIDFLLQNQETFQKYHLNQNDDKFQIQQYLLQKYNIKKKIQPLLLSQNYVSLNNRIAASCLTYIYQKFIIKQQIKSQINFKNNLQNVKRRCENIDQFKNQGHKGRNLFLINMIKKNDFSKIESTASKNNMISFCSGYQCVGDIVLACQDFKRNLFFSKKTTNGQKQDNICDFMLPFIVNKHFQINQNIGVFDKLFDHSRINQYLISKDNAHAFQVNIQIKFLPTHLSDLLIAINFVYQEVRLLVTDLEEKPVFNNLKNLRQKNIYDKHRFQSLENTTQSYSQVIFGQSFNFTVKKNCRFKSENSMMVLKSNQTMHQNYSSNNLLNKSIAQIETTLLKDNFSNAHLMQELKFSHFKNRKDWIFLNKVVFFVVSFLIDMTFCAIFTWAAYSNIQKFAQNRQSFIIGKRQIFENFGMNDQILSINVGSLIAVKQNQINFNTQLSKQAFLQTITSSMQSVRSNIKNRYSLKEQQTYLNLNFGQLLYNKNWIQTQFISFFMRQLLLQTQAIILYEEFYNISQLKSMSASYIVQNNLISFKENFYQPFSTEYFNLFSNMTYLLATQPQGINLNIQEMQAQLSKDGIYSIYLLLIVGLSIAVILSGFVIYVYLIVKKDCLLYLNILFNCSNEFMQCCNKENQNLKNIIQTFRISKTQNFRWKLNNRSIKSEIQPLNQIKSNIKSKKSQAFLNKFSSISSLKSNKQLEFSDKQQIKINPLFYSKYKLLTALSIFTIGAIGYIQMAISIKNAIVIWDNHSDSINKLNLIVLTQEEIIRTLYLNQFVGQEVNVTKLKQNLQALKNMDFYQVVYGLTSDSDFTRQLMNISYQTSIGNSTFNFTFLQTISNINLNIQIILNHNVSHSQILGQQNAQFLTVNKLIRPFSDLTTQIINESWAKINVISDLYKYWLILIQVLVCVQIALMIFQAFYILREGKIWKIQLLSMLTTQNLKTHPEIQRIINLSQRQQIPYCLQAINQQ